MSLRFILNGSTRVDTSTNVAVMPDTCTILAWILPTTIDATYQAVVEKTPGSFSDYRGVGVNGTTGEVAGFMRRGSPSFTGIEVAKTGLLQANKWQFIGVQMDGTSSSASDQKIFYANEKSLPSEVYSYTTQDPGSGATSPSASASMTIGNNVTGASEGFPGLIHSVAIWGRKMDISEIRYWKQMMQAGKFHPSHLNSFFMYLGRNTGTQRDLSGNNFHGTITGAITVPSAPTVTERFFAPWAASSGGASNFTQNLAGGLSPAGAISRAASISRGGGLTPAAVLRKSVIVIRNGVIIPGGALQKSTMITSGGLIVPAGSVGNSTSKPVGGNATPAGSLRNDIAKAFGGGITPGGTIETLKVILKSIAGSLTPAGTKTEAVSIAKAGSLSPSGSLRNDIAKAFGGGITPGSSLAALKVILQALAGSIAGSGSLARQTSIARGGSVVPAGNTRSLIAKLFAGQITPAGTLEALKVVMLSLAGAIAPAGSLQRSIIKSLGGSLAPAGSLAKSIAKILTAAIAAAGNLITSVIQPEMKGDVIVSPFRLATIEVTQTRPVTITVTPYTR